MDEKFSALETFAGLISRKQWDVPSSSKQSKTHISKTQTVISFQTKANHVIKPFGKDSDLMIDKAKEECNEPKSYKSDDRGKDEKKQNIPLKSCCEEMKKSEFDIPDNDKAVMHSNCDETLFKSKEKAEEICKSQHAENNVRKDTKLHKKDSVDETSEEIESSESEYASQISSTVLEWVNHLPLKGDVLPRENTDCSEPREESQGIVSNEDKPLVRAELSREASLQSSSSLDSILDSRRPDPVEIFLNLGFGGVPGVDTENCRIPKRFLVPSKCKGGDWNEFLKRELLQAQNFECSSLGFRGLSGPSYRRPSAIVANIMEKLRERTVPQPHNRSRFSTVAKMVLNEKSVLNKLTPEFQSVLSPDSRKFLQNQGKKSPEVPRRRIIFGQKSFAFAHDGEFIEVESSNIEEITTKNAPTDCDSEENKVYPDPDVLLKLRRSSFQKQKKIEEDTDVDNIFYVVGNEKRSTDTSYINDTDIKNSCNNNECSKKAGKIPRRFLSSGNLKGLEEKAVSEAIRLEVEKEILSLSQKIKKISNQDLPTVLQQVKELRSKIEKNGQE